MKNYWLDSWQYVRSVHKLSAEDLDEKIKRLSVPSWSEENAPFDWWNQHRDREWYQVRRLREREQLLQERERRMK